MGNPFIYVQLHTKDREKAKEFYGRLFDWNFEDSPGPEPYTEVKVGEGTAGGLMKQKNPNAPSHWLPYVIVDDVDRATEQARQLGATIVQPPQDVPPTGRYSVILDPTGAALGLWHVRK